jgi:DNA-binding transcriptional ArsR family regulator
VGHTSSFIEKAIDTPEWREHSISMDIEQAAKQLEALGNPTRLQVYRTLVQAGETGCPVGRIQENLDIPASTLSHHLHRLILTGLVTQERQGTTLICRANYPMMKDLLGFLADECCADACAQKKVDSDAA